MEASHSGSKASRVAAARHEWQVDRELHAALRTFMARTPPGTHGVLLAPSTERTFKSLATLHLPAGAHFVGHTGMAGMETPANLVTALAPLDPGIKVPQVQQVIIFTDQLVGATEATVAVSRRGAETHVSPLEFILCNQFGFELYALNGTTLAHLPPGASFTSVMDLVLDHLGAASLLGDAWLARDMQAQRTLSNRKFQSRRYIRAMQSSILGMLGRTGLAWQPVFEDRLRALDASYPRG